MPVYILDGTEVKRTGREAVKKNGDKIIATMIEVVPVNPDDGNWTRWVRLLDLYEVVEPTKGAE